LVEVALDVDAHCAGAFVQDGVDWLVVNQASHGNALFLTSGEDVVPVSNGVPGAFSAYEVVEAHFIQDDLKALLINLFSSHLFDGVRVDNLVTKCALRQIGSLRDVEDLVNGWLVDYATEDWPELTEDTEQRRFTATVGSCDEEIHPRLDLKVHGSDQDIPVR
jgi:hypothetical protein